MLPFSNYLKKFMISRKIKTYILFLSAVLTANLLSACVVAPEKSTGPADDDGKIGSVKDEPTDTGSIDTSEEKQRVLAIGPGCIGCGFCSQVDPEHFSQDRNRSQAEVISQDNLSSSRLRQAVTGCRPRAISLQG